MKRQFPKMLPSEDDIFRIYPFLHEKAQKKPPGTTIRQVSRQGIRPRQPDELCRTSPSGRRGNKIPRTSINARNAPNFDYLDPGHINPHPAYKNPKFGLFCPKNGKYHVNQTPHLHQELFPKPKNTPKSHQKTRSATLMTPR